MTHCTMQMLLLKSKIETREKHKNFVFWFIKAFLLSTSATKKITRFLLLAYVKTLFWKKNVAKWAADKNSRKKKKLHQALELRRTRTS